jgi:hypothetical protein
MTSQKKHVMIPVYPDTKRNANELRKGGETWEQFFRRMVLGDKK